MKSPKSRAIQNKNIKKTLYMWRKFRFGFSLKIDWTLGKISNKKSFNSSWRNIDGANKDLSLSLWQKQNVVQGTWR